MGGIAGILNWKGENVKKVLDNMLEFIRYEGMYSVAAQIGERNALGLTTFGILNSAKQPVWDKDNKICIVLDGEDGGIVLFSFGDRNKDLKGIDMPFV